MFRHCLNYHNFMFRHCLNCSIAIPSLSELSCVPSLSERSSFLSLSELSCVLPLSELLHSELSCVRHCLTYHVLRHCLNYYTLNYHVLYVSVTVWPVMCYATVWTITLWTIMYYMCPSLSDPSCVTPLSELLHSELSCVRHCHAVFELSLSVPHSLDHHHSEQSLSEPFLSHHSVAAISLH